MYLRYEVVNCSVVDGGWSTWRLGPCSKTCGGGIQNYTRLCDNPKPSCGGRKCKGPSTDSSNCSDICCPGKIMFILTGFQLVI